MRKLLTLAVASAMICGAGCAKPVAKMWEASGGSRADATVEVGFVFNPELEIPQMSDAQALAEAVKRCQAWGYADAEPFGMIKRQCQQFRPAPFGGTICTNMYVTRQYQCLGRGDNATVDPNFIGPMKPRN